MNKQLALLPALAALTAAATVHADGLADLRPHAPVERRLSPVKFAMRVGLAVPSGRIDSGSAASEVFGPAMTTDLHLDVRVGSRLILAPYAGYRQGAAGSALKRVCDSSSSNKDCGVAGFQVGGMARYTVARTTAVDVWLGYAFSRQWLAFASSDVAAKFRGNDHHFSIGTDFYVNSSSDTRMGAYLDLGVGRYDDASLTVVGAGTVKSSEPGLHQWTTLGAQFVF